MAGRFDFQSVGGAATNAIRNVLAEQEELRRQAVLEEMNRAREARLLEQGKRDDEIAREQIAALKGQREATEVLNRQRAEAAQIEQAQKLYDPGQILTPEQAGPVPVGLRVADKTLDARTIAIPESSMSPAIPAREMPGQETGDFRYTGTSSERARQSFIDDPNTPESARQFLRVAGENANVPYQLLEDQTVPVFRTSADRRTIERLSESGQWVPHTGPLPEKHRILNEAQADDGRPYFPLISSPEGQIPYDARTGRHFNPKTGQWEIGAVGFRPSGTALASLYGGEQTLANLDWLDKNLKPEYIGPAEGRIRSFQSKYTPEGSFIGAPEGTSEFQTRVSALRNAFIKAITGAQMSEPEARRIMQQLPDVNLPEDTFRSRVKASRNEMASLITRTWEIATGMRPPNPDAVSEDRVAAIDRELYGGGAAPSSPAPAPATAETPPTTPPRRRYDINGNPIQ